MNVSEILMSSFDEKAALVLLTDAEEERELS